MTALAVPDWCSAAVPSSRRRAWSASAVQAIRPSLVLAGTPGTMSSHFGSVSSRISVVSPLAGSAWSSRTRRWSRLCTTSSGSAAFPDQLTVTRYGNSARSQRTSAWLPSSRANSSDTSALAVPAAG